MLARLPRDRHSLEEKNVTNPEEASGSTVPRLVCGPPMLRWEGDVEKPHDSRPCSIVGPERRGVPAAGRRKRDVFFLGQCSLFQ